MAIKYRPALIVVTLAITFSFVFVYCKYFRRPPTEELLRMNSKSRSFSSVRDISDSGENDSRSDSRTSDNEYLVWEQFLAKNKFVSVGEVWDRGCDDNPRKQIGVVVLLPDDTNGGIMTRTFLNYTLEKDIEEGEFYIDVRYNGKELFDNHWDLCTLEENIEDDQRTVYCPVKRGFKTEIKDRHVPNYLPKGKYYTKSWIETSEGAIVMCGYSEFVL